MLHILLLTGLLRRLYLAGCCAALFDATFFTGREVLQDHATAPVAYGCAAALAVVVGFPLDTAIAKVMVMPPTQASPRLRDVFTLRGAYRGCPARALEFTVSYAVTGLCALAIARLRARADAS